MAVELAPIPLSAGLLIPAASAEITSVAGHWLQHFKPHAANHHDREFGLDPVWRYTSSKMGSWSAKIFGDDEALDIKGDFRDLIARGKTPEEATTELEQRWQPDTDPDGPALFWISLAAAQAEMGRLTVRAKTRALQLIADGAGLDRYDDNPKKRTARLSALDDLRILLIGPQRKPVRVKRDVAYITSWELGTILSWRQPSGHFRLLRVVSYFERRGNRFATVEVLEGRHCTVPNTNHLRGLRSVLDRYSKRRLEIVLLSDVEKCPSLGVVAVLSRKWTNELKRLLSMRREGAHAITFLTVASALDGLIDEHSGKPW